MMASGRFHSAFALALIALLLVQTGCAGFRSARRQDSSPSAVAESSQSADGVELPKQAEIPCAPTNRSRLALDRARIAALQDEHLMAQGEPVGSVICPEGSFAACLDRWHSAAYKWMDNAVRSIDTRWLKEDTPYDAELSTFKLALHTRAGGRSSKKDFDLKARVRADVALPGLENKLHLLFESASHDDLPGTDPLDQENDARLGLKTVWKTVRNSQISLGGGGRFSGLEPVLYFDLDWHWQRPWAGGEVRLHPRGFWYSDDGWGQVTTLSWTRRLTERQIFQLRGAEKSTEQTDGVEFEQSMRFAWLRSGVGRGWLIQASVFPHLKSSEWYWDNLLVNLTWRDAVYRKWIYYTITPQLEFPREDDYQPRPSIRVGLEILFGGSIGHLM